MPEALVAVRDNRASPLVPLFDDLLVNEYQDLNQTGQVLLRELACDDYPSVVSYEN